MSNMPRRLRMARWLLCRWPFGRGRSALERTLLGGFDRWPSTAEIDFQFGHLVDVSIAPWPKGYREVFLHGVLEPPELLVWQRAVRPGDLVVDVGANMGYWSLVAAALVSPGGRVLAFEPLPSTAAYLRTNIRASNREDVVEIYELALTDRDGTGVLHAYENDPFHGSASLGSDPARTISAQARVITRSLDNVLDHQGPKPALLKLDIEGGELNALRGASRILASDAPPIITVEWNVSASEALGHHPMEILELLRDHGYRFHLATVDRLEPFIARSSTDWIPMVWCLPSHGEFESRLTGMTT